MYIISLNYKQSLEQVDKYLNDHIDFLNHHFSEGNFIMAGRKNPRTGGIIISTLKDKNKLTQIVESDPFIKNQVADYEIIEFVATMTSQSLNFLSETL